MSQPPDASGGGVAPGMPRWVKVAIAILVVLGLLAVALMLVGGHGPGRHM